MSWHNMDYPDATRDGDMDAPDIWNVLGRSLLHNRTPLEMLKCLDEIKRVTSPDALGVIDFPNIDIPGVYKERVQHLKENYTRLGVEESVAALIFDGPDTGNKYNRMALSEDQLNTYGKLLGLRFSLMGELSMGDGDTIKNDYYLVEKDPSYNPTVFSVDDLEAMLKNIGVQDLRTFETKFINAWGMFVHQARIGGLGDNSSRMRNMGTVRKGERVKFYLDASVGNDPSVQKFATAHSDRVELVHTSNT